MPYYKIFDSSTTGVNGAWQSTHSFMKFYAENDTINHYPLKLNLIFLCAAPQHPSPTKILLLNKARKAVDLHKLEPQSLSDFPFTNWIHTCLKVSDVLS